MPNRTFYIVWAMLLAMFTTSAAQVTYTVDQDLSKVTFKVSHLGLLTVDGRFSEFNGQLIIDEGQLIALRSIVNVSSIFTDNKERDDILKSDTYFDAVQHPIITFEATSFEQTDDNENVLEGVMTIKGVEQTIEFPYTIEFINNNFGLLLKAEPNINRSDFNLDFGSMNSLVGDKVRINLIIYAYR